LNDVNHFTKQKHFYGLFQGLLNEQISSFKEAAICYISGYVVKMVRKKIQCATCLEALTAPLNDREDRMMLQKRKTWGGLIVSSPDVISICLETEKQFTILQTNQTFSSLSNLKAKITSFVIKNLFEKTD